MMSIRLLSTLAFVSFLGAVSLVGCGPSGDRAEPATGEATGGAALHAEAVDETAAMPAVAPQALRPQQEESLAKSEPTPTPDPPGVPDLAGWQVGSGHRGVHTVAWRVVDRTAVPRNEEFEIDVLILRDGVPQPGMRLAVSGWMPEHEHGLVRSPLLEEVGSGRYRVSGMLLHMRGSWQLRFQVFAGRDTETATFDVEL